MIGEEIVKQIIIRNRIRGKHCGNIIESKMVPDFKYCLCGTVFVDGGHDYLRRGYMNSDDDYEDLSEVDSQEE